MPYSRSSVRLRPGLLVCLAAVAAAAVPAAAPTARAAEPAVTTPATADARIAHASPDTNFAAATTLEVDTDPLVESLLTFTVADPGAPVSTATLRLFVANATANAPKVYRSDPGWSEGTVTWNSRPLRFEVVADAGPVSAGKFVDYDVTAAVTGPGVVSFDLVPDSNDRAAFHSREASANTPVLLIETATSAPPPTSPPRTSPPTMPPPTSPPAPPPSGAPGSITTLAGTRPAGFAGDGGPATAARLKQPRTMASDAAGNVYIVDTYNNRIRRVDPNGIITTIGGTGAAGYGGDGGPAISARFDTPHGIASDPDGNVYVADPPNQRIRRIDHITGIVTTVAGTGKSGYSGDGAPATAARLKFPKGVEIAPDGSLYIADNNTHVVRRVDLVTGIITTVAGTGKAGFSGDGGPATAARLDDPRNIAFDSFGRLYIVDQDNGRIRRVDTTGVITTFAAGFELPRDVAVDPHDSVYVADENANRIWRVSPTGAVSPFAGSGKGGLSGDAGPADAAKISAPLGVAFDAATDTILIGDTGNSRIRAVPLS